jgi:hypothetical protein
MPSRYGRAEARPSDRVDKNFLHSLEDFGGLGFSPAEKRPFEIGFSR